MWNLNRDSFIFLCILKRGRCFCLETICLGFFLNNLYECKKKIKLSGMDSYSVGSGVLVR